MICTIEWKDNNAKDWADRYKMLSQANLLQSCAYGHVLRAINGYEIRAGLIRINGTEAGLVLALETGALGNALHAFVVDRGPLWFDGYGSVAHSHLFFEELNRLFPRRPGRRRRIIPEISDNEEIQKLMKSLGYRRSRAPGYQTIWLDLERDIRDLQAAMSKDWRQSCKKAKEKGLKIVWDREGRYLPWFLKAHGLDKAKRGYRGPELPFVKALSEAFMAEGDMLLGCAILDDVAVAAVLILCHGSAATYQAGWSDMQGRKASANHLLLSEALSVLKEKGIRDFDLGGVNDEEAAGVKHFKMGIGGKLVRFAGHYS